MQQKSGLVLATMDRDHYIECVLMEHLLANGSYRQLTEKEAKHRMSRT